MDSDALPAPYVAGLSTGVAYLLLLVVLFVALFVVPYAVFVAL